MRKLCVLIGVITVLISSAYAQIERPVKWSYASKKVNDKEVVILLKAIIDKGWHIYSVNQKNGGPIKTSFTFRHSPEYTVSEKVIEPEPVTHFERSFGMNVSYFENSVIFRQNVRLRSGKTTVIGALEFMACNDHKCLPPEDVDFKLAVK